MKSRLLSIYLGNETQKALHVDSIVKLIRGLACGLLGDIGLSLELQHHDKGVYSIMRNRRRSGSYASHRVFFLFYSTCPEA